MSARWGVATLSRCTDSIRAISSATWAVRAQNDAASSISSTIESDAARARCGVLADEQQQLFLPAPHRCCDPSDDPVTPHHLSLPSISTSRSACGVLADHGPAYGQAG